MVGPWAFSCVNWSATISTSQLTSRCTCRNSRFSMQILPHGSGRGSPAMKRPLNSHTGASTCVTSRQSCHSLPTGRAHRLNPFAVALYDSWWTPKLRTVCATCASRRMRRCTWCCWPLSICSSTGTRIRKTSSLVHLSPIVTGTMWNLSSASSSTPSPCEPTCRVTLPSGSWSPGSDGSVWMHSPTRTIPSRNSSTRCSRSAI